MNDNQLSRIYREGAWPEPSRQIDQAILAASRRAAREERPFARRWAPTFAVAATVVLTSAIVLKVVREQPEVVSPSPADKDPGIRVMREATVSEPKPAETRATSTAPPQPVATPQGFSSTMDAAEAARLDRLQRDFDVKSATTAAPKSVPSESPAPAAKKEPAQRAREQVAPASVIAPVSVFGATPAAPVPQARAAKPTLALPASKEAPPAPLPEQAPQTPPPAPSAAAISGQGLIAAKVERTPQAWIEDIRRLMKEGKSEEAGGQLAEFKKRYPDYVLPEELR